jgi:hypothetical protein
MKELITLLWPIILIVFILLTLLVWDYIDIKSKPKGILTINSKMTDK